MKTFLLYIGYIIACLLGAAAGWIGAGVLLQ